MPREVTARQPLSADIDGFSQHAAVRVEAHERKRLERLCRHIIRPALSDEPVQLNAAGQVELELKMPWRDETIHLAMSPLEFMQRLAALVVESHRVDRGQERGHQRPALAAVVARPEVARRAVHQQPWPVRVASIAPSSGTRHWPAIAVTNQAVPASVGCAATAGEGPGRPARPRRPSRPR